jgi:uncharacterized protein with HEPN domain
MKRETAKRLLDAKTACLEIESFTAHESMETMLSDRTLQLAVQKLLENVGEALRRANGSEPDVTSALPILRLAIDMRNRLTHGYDSVDYALVWRVATEEVPRLRGDLETLLQQVPPVEEA